MPDRPGMRTSSSTTSGCSSLQQLSASSPLPASATTWQSPISSSSRRSRSRAGASSSTIRSFISFSIREDQPGAKLGFVLLRLHARAARPRELEALADVFQCHAIAFALAVTGLWRDGIAYLDFDLPIHEPADDAHLAAARQHLDAMKHRVLQQRLHDQAGHFGAQRQLVDVPAHLQPIAEAQLLDALVSARNLEFLLEGDHGVRFIEAGAK